MRQDIQKITLPKSEIVKVEVPTEEIDDEL
jgi:hypothetical protein